ncbi:IgG-binding virulence factor TspB family protein [Neisseria gonorrhoeae]|uniref:IgG-binding virulence factor TspB family protein n=1 Tax=Neisseria gonorrhoeae TaxID=485 RepID=UPI0037C8065C
MHRSGKFRAHPHGAKARINAKITASVSRARRILSGSANLSGKARNSAQGRFLCRNSPFSPRRIPNFQRRHKGTRLPIRSETDKFVKGYEYSNCIWTS